MIIQLNHVAIFQGKSAILNDVHFSMKKGEFVYLIGKTGAGKSSLLKTLYGDLPLTQGSGSVCGFDLKSITWKNVPFLRRKMGIVFQDFQLLTDRNVHDNLTFALEAIGWNDTKKINARIEEVLDLVGIKTKGFKMPYELSGGEQQRVVIARSLLNHPELILADEPTGNLDPETSDEIIQLLMRIARESNTAMLIGTHDYIIMQKFPARTIKCEAGKVMDASGDVAQSFNTLNQETASAETPAAVAYSNPVIVGNTTPIVTTVVSSAKPLQDNNGMGSITNNAANMPSTKDQLESEEEDSIVGL
jgi:cell division transport system ATP-binding protein